MTPEQQSMMTQQKQQAIATGMPQPQVIFVQKEAVEFTDNPKKKCFMEGCNQVGS